MVCSFGRQRKRTVLILFTSLPAQWHKPYVAQGIDFQCATADSFSSQKNTGLRKRKWVSQKVDKVDMGL